MPRSLIRLNSCAQALRVLAHFSRGVDEVVPALLREVEMSHFETRGREFLTALALRRAAERLHPTPAVVPILIKALESRNRAVRSVAVVLLGHLGPDARSAASALVAVARETIRSSQGSAESREESLFEEIAATIVQVLPADDAIAILREAMSSGDPAIKGIAAWALGDLGPQGVRCCADLARGSQECW